MAEQAFGICAVKELLIPEPLKRRKKKNCLLLLVWKTKFLKFIYIIMSSYEFSKLIYECIFIEVPSVYCVKQNSQLCTWCIYLHINHNNYSQNPIEMLLIHTYRECSWKRAVTKLWYCQLSIYDLIWFVFLSMPKF